MTLDERFWDEHYETREQLWSGRPNGPLVDEVADLPPGQALDIGCGEGGDAIWLAERGWQVTASDIARTALDRAAEAASRAGHAERIAWLHADLTGTPPPAGSFDLVAMHYIPIPKAGGDRPLRGIIAAVAPGGTLLVAGHALADMAEHHALDSRFGQPSDYYRPGDFTPLLGAGWTVRADEVRARTMPAPEGTPHIRDEVLVAVRRA